MIERNTPIFFKKLPQTEETKTNAVYIRSLGQLNGEEICEIKYLQELWKVAESEVLTERMGRLRRAQQIDGEISAVRTDGMKNKQLADALKISTSTLKKRLEFCQNHLLVKARNAA